MKKILIWLLLLAAVVALVYLVDKGIIAWQPLTVAVAALLAPLKFISGLFGSDEDEIREKHRRTREREGEFQAAVEAEVQRREQRVQKLQTEVAGVDDELERLADRREALPEEIGSESASQLLNRLGRIQG